MNVLTSLNTLEELEAKAVKSLRYNFETLKKVSAPADRQFVYATMRKCLEVAINEAELLSRRED